MAFEGLSEKLQGVFKGLKGKGTLSEADINNAIRQIKLALLEADVNFKVVKEFVATIKEKALGEEVIKSVTPGQQIVKIVNDELAALMGGAGSKLTNSLPIRTKNIPKPQLRPQSRQLQNRAAREITTQLPPQLNRQALQDISL